MPGLIPPPAIHNVNALGLWSRPAVSIPFSICAIGMRPNSPPQTTSVSFSRRPEDRHRRERRHTGRSGLNVDKVILRGVALLLLIQFFQTSASSGPYLDRYV